MSITTVETPIKQSWEALEATVFQALGEASMCWGETPKGVFDTRNATRIGVEVMQAIRAHIMVAGGSTCDVIPFNPKA